jgi:hypothetical protein
MASPLRFHITYFVRTMIPIMLCWLRFHDHLFDGLSAVEITFKGQIIYFPSCPPPPPKHLPIPYFNIFPYEKKTVISACLASTNKFCSRTNRRNFNKIQYEHHGNCWVTAILALLTERSLSFVWELICCGSCFWNVSAARNFVCLFSIRPDADFVWTLIINIHLYILNDSNS